MSAHSPLSAALRSDPTQVFWRDPAMPFVESRRACHSRACYKPHYHPTFSIGAIDEGRSIFTGTADGPVVLHPGTLVFVPAARVHACNPAPNTAWSYQMLHLDADWLRAVRQEYTQASPMDAEPVRVVTDPAVYTRFCQFNALLFSEASPCDKEAALIEFIGDCDTTQDLRIEAPNVPLNLAVQIQPALHCLRTEPASSIALDELARLAGMSRYQVIRAFRAVTGMTPHSWQLNQRINLAKERIRSGDGISDVAQSLGFADQAHFQRVFKAYAGVTPGRFRA
ncbi:helix-turn-helix transcriptional regulator [Ralstonia sp. UBA689]|uniref:helix-turn-helix transcriptional regulator n=1 Tax=Ralstonia sp. UBA689 TaxID=1947373 RepID=UPI0025D26274|nr:AraC family transcriptional regulator [Ralstonia sp. UBA689]